MPTFKYRFRASPDFAPRFGDIRLRGRLIQRVWDEPDGSRTIESTEAAFTLHAVRRILSFGQHVRVLWPGALVDEIGQTLERMVAQYALPGKP